MMPALIALFASTASHPARGAWIEITRVDEDFKFMICRTPQGVRGLKSFGVFGADIVRDVAPRKGCVD